MENWENIFLIGYFIVLGILIIIAYFKQRKESIESGAAYRKLKELVKFSGGDLSKLEQLETEHV